MQQAAAPAARTDRLSCRGDEIVGCRSGTRVSLCSVDILPVKPGAKLAAIIDRLEWVAREADNANNWSGGPDSTMADRLARYLTWSEDVEPQLRNVFQPEFVTDLVRTTGYWTLRTISPDAIRLNTLIRTEYEGRGRAMDGLIQQLKQEQVRWEKKAAPLIVPDTTMFLDKDHPVDSINWAAEIGAKIDARLVVPLIVIHELDRLKRQGNNTTGTLARTAIRWLSERLPKDVDGYSAVLGDATPATTVEAYVHRGPSRPDDADGIIIEFCLWLAAISNLPTTLLTRDLGMSLRARSQGIEVVHIRPPAS